MRACTVCACKIETAEEWHYSVCSKPVKTVWLEGSHCVSGLDAHDHAKVQKLCQTRPTISTIVKLNLHNAGDGSGPRYTFVYPNTMVNRYSMWMGTIRVCVQLSIQALIVLGCLH